MCQNYTIIDCEMNKDLSHKYWNSEELEENKVFNVIKNGYEGLEKSQHLRKVYNQFITLTDHEIIRKFKECKELQKFQLALALDGLKHGGSKTNHLPMLA